MLLRLCEEDACGKSRECSDKRTGERVAGFFDSGSHKVNTHRIEDCLCTRQRDRCDHTKTGVCAELCEKIEEESSRCRRREHFYDSKRNEFAGKTDPSGKVFKQTGNEIKEPGSAEYSDGRHKSDKRRHDPNDCKKTAFCSFDKCFVNIDLCGQTVNDDA